MNRVYTPIENTAQGPWLLNQKSLEELDKVIEYARNKVTEAYESRSETNISTNRTDTIILWSEDKKGKQYSSIKSLLTDRQNDEAKPKSLNIYMGYPLQGYNFRFDINCGMEGFIYYHIGLNNDTIEEEIKYELDKWLREYRATQPVRFFVYSFYAVIGFGGIVLFLMAFNMWDNTVYEGNLNNEANKLITQGINDSNIAKAVEVSLKIQTKYVPPDFVSKTIINPEGVRLFILSAIIYIVVLFTPRTTIGIGKSAGWVTFYKKWIILAITIIPTTFIYPKLVILVRQWFSI